MAQVDFGALGAVDFPDEWSDEELRSHIEANGRSIRDDLIRRNQEANLAEAEVEAGPDTGMEMLGSAAGSALEGLSRTVGSTLKTANRALNFAAGWYEPDLVETPVGRQALATEETPAESMARINSGPGIELGTAIEEGAAAVAPTLPASRNTFWAGDVPQGLGNVAGMVGVGMVGGPVAGVMSGFGSEADDAFTEELKRQQESGEEPSVDKAMLKSLGYGSVASAIEGGLGAGRIIRKFRSAFGGKTTEETLANAVKKGVSGSMIGDLLKGAAKEGAAGFSEEALQRFSEDMIVQGKPNVEGMVREGAAGGVVQALVGIPADVRSRMNPRRAVTTEVAVQAEAAGMPKTANVIADMEIATEQIDAPDLAVEDVTEFATDPQTDAVMRAADEARKAAVAAQEISTQEVTETPAPTPANEPATAEPDASTEPGVREGDTGNMVPSVPTGSIDGSDAVSEVGIGTSPEELGTVPSVGNYAATTTPDVVGGGTTIPGSDAAVVGTDPGTGVSTVAELAPAVLDQPTVPAGVAEAEVVTAPEPVQPAPAPVVNEAQPSVTPTEPQATPQETPSAEAVAPKVEENPFDTSATSKALTDLQRSKPRPINKLYGKSPTQAQRESHENAMRVWSREYRKAQKSHRDLVKKSNDWIADNQPRDRVLSVLDRAIEATDPRGKAFDVVSGVSHVVANTILKAVRAAYKGGKALTAAIRDAIAEYRAANPTATFDDNALSDWLASSIGTSEGPTTTKRGNVEDTVQSRPVLNEATALDSRQEAEAAFAEAGVKVNREEGNNLFTPDTALEQEIAGRKLLAVARRRIREAREQDRPERTAVLIDSLRQNFATSPAFSEGLRTELAILGQSEASSRGRALGALSLNARELGGIARDINGELYRQLSEEFNGQGIATVMDSVMSKFRDLFTPSEIRGIAKKAVRMMDLMDRINLPVEDVVQDVMESPIGTKENTAKAFSAAIQKRRPISPALADKMGTVLADLFWSKFRAAKKKALTEVNQELKPEDRKSLGPTSPAGKAIKETIDEGGIDTSEVLKKLGKLNGIKPPSDAWVKEFQYLADEERRLRRLTDADKANGVTQSEKDAMTIGQRAEIIRKMRAMWAGLTRPLRWNKANIAHAVNEYVSANLLARPSFGTKQIIDVATQMFYYTPTRAVAEAVQRFQSDRASGRESRLWKDVSSAVKDAYAQRTKAFQMAIAQAKDAAKGRSEKEVVAGIQTGVMALERLTELADKLDSEGKHAQAFVVRAASMVKLSFRFAAALDNLQGTLAEQQEMRAQVETELREQGMTPAEAKAKAKEIMGDQAAEYALAQAVVGNNPDVTDENRAAAAWNVVRARQYQRMDLAGVPADAFREINQQLRETIGWNQKETAGPGGIVGNFVSGISEYAASLGIPMPVARFGNAIATGINRGLTFAGGGWFPAAFEGSPWYATPKDRTQRKIEAATGMALGASLISLVLSGVVKVFTRWPDDKEERDLWERDGHRPNTVEMDIGNGEFLRVSMSVGPLAVLRPFLSAAGEVSRALEKRRKANERSAKAAGKKGAEFQPVELDANEMLNIAAFAAWNSIMQGRTTGGLIGGSTFEGKFDVKKSAVSMVSPLIPFQPLERELGNLAGANIDPKTATFTDLLFPTPWSEGNKLNFLGDPVGTGKDQDRIISILTGGTTLSGGQESEKAYRLVKETGWTPPTVNPSQYLTFGADMRQMTKEELKQFNLVRAKTLKERLNAIDESDRIEPQMETALKVATAQARQAIGAR